jgi:hypothetical protein
MRFAVFFMMLLLALPLEASEVDSFTHRHALKDSAPLLNKVIDVWMEEAVIDANKPPLISDITADAASPGCDETRLMSALKDHLAAYLVGQLETFANESTALDTIKTPFSDSIYRDFDFTETPSISLTERLAVLLRIGDTYLGADKLGHFFTEGYAYYERYLAEGEQSALLYGDLTESSYFGELTTGIFSFADLTANLNGLRFWNSIRAHKADPIDRSVPVQPYIACHNHKWKRIRDFDWNDYVDDAWDEVINCNGYRDISLMQKAQNRIRQASAGKACPLRPPPKAQLQQKYGHLLPSVFNAQGPRVLKSFSRSLQQYWDEIARKLDLALDQGRSLQ